MKNKISKSRARNIKARDLAIIVSIIDNWGGKLTWPLLIKSIARQLHQTYSRQALFAHDEIALAFSNKKELLRGRPRSGADNASPELRAALAKIELLTTIIERQTKVLDAFKELFARWSYNASVANLSESFLSRPLPPVHRGQTRLPAPKVRSQKT